MIQRTPEELVGELSSVAKRYAPPALYLQGDESLLASGVRVSVIGTRKPTSAGEKTARLLAEFLVAKGVTVVSGLAMGIDTVAHRTAIRCGGRTIAVLGTPLDKVSPTRNAELQRMIGEQHLLVSQFAPGSPVARGNFPQRNRTMALLSDASVIVEAGESSGTLHQGYETLRLGRPLFIMRAVVESGLEWPKTMLQYGAISIGLPEEDEGALYEALPLNLGSRAESAF